MKKRSFAWPILFVMCLFGAKGIAWSYDPAFGELIEKLLSDNQDSSRIVELFQNEEVRFIDELVPLNMIARENPDIYSGFLNKEQIEEGFRFLRSWNGEFENILEGTGIQVEIAVAILKVESDLGRRTGDHMVFSTFATIASMNDPQYWKQIADTSTTLDANSLHNRARKRSKWAYRELVSLLDLCEREGWNPLTIKGSWAGAFGWAQFLPSSYAHCARDGDGDQTVDLDNPYDAVASIACYLRKARWGESAASRRKALHRYNPSEAYVDCILDYAQQLRVLAQERGLANP